MILVYITNPDKKIALKVSYYLLEKRLIGCAVDKVNEDYLTWLIKSLK